MRGGWIQASVSIPCTARSQSRWRTGVADAGTGDSPVRPTASTQAFQRRCTARRSSPARSSSSLRAADADRAFAGTSVRNRDNAAVSSRIHESSWPVAAGMPCSTTARQRSRRDADASHIARAPSAELFVEQRLDVPGENAARRELIAIPRLGQERFALQPFGGALDRLFERQVLECVQGVVVNEDADRALCRQQVRQLIDHTRQRMVRCAGVVWAGIVEHRRLESIEIF